MKYVKTLLFVLAAWVIIVLVLFIAFAFVTAYFNPFNWSQDARLALTVLCVILFFTSFAVAGILSND